jgi:hypothetical protein
VSINCRVTHLGLMVRGNLSCKYSW